MFAYCGNDPVNYQDPSGQFPFALLWVLHKIWAALDPTPYGAAQEYEPTDSMQYNCFAYALGETEQYYIEDKPIENINILKATVMTIKRVKSMGRSIRVISSYDSPISDNEYRIALRTGEADYHFMVQHSDGTWSHKPGSLKSRLIDGANPSVVSWDYPNVDMDAFYSTGQIIESGVTPNCYTSLIVYFAITEE